MIWSIFSIVYTQNGGQSSTSPASAPSGMDATHRNRMSPAIRNFVSPPARRTPLVRMAFMDWKITMNSMASSNSHAMARASSDT